MIVSAARRHGRASSRAKLTCAAAEMTIGSGIGGATREMMGTAPPHKRPSSPGPLTGRPRIPARQGSVAEALEYRIARSSRATTAVLAATPQNQPQPQDLYKAWP